MYRVLYGATAGAESAAEFESLTEGIESSPERNMKEKKHKSKEKHKSKKHRSKRHHQDRSSSASDSESEGGDEGPRG